ncbi:hypothetical protein HOY80DRAFT_881397 [Tuber brumale]|nr:hypothetical protein HOY80DRAFT_881397 [Tuber brumale]
MLQEREEGGKKGEEVVGDLWDSRRWAISVSRGLDLDRQHQELDIKCDSQKPHSGAAPLDMPLKKPTSLARKTETEAKSSPLGPMPARKEWASPQNPRDSEIGIALGVRDSSLGVQVGPERSSWGAGSDWRLLPEGQVDTMLSGPPLPQAPLAEQDSAAALVKTPESRKLQIPTLSPWFFSKPLPTPVPQPLFSPKYVGQTQAACLTPTIHRESFITATEGGMHRGGVSGSSGGLSPFSPCWDFTGEHSVGRSSYQSTGSDTVQYESGTEEGYESEISQTTFATDPGFITPRSTTPTGTECLDSKREPAQDLSSFNRTLLKNEVELAMKTLLYGLAGQVGSPKGLSWDSC